MIVDRRQARHGLMAPWAIGMNAKEYRAAVGRKPVIGLFSVEVEEAYRSKDSVQSADEIRLWVADLIANGMRPWYTEFAATLHGRGGRPPREARGEGPRPSRRVDVPAYGVASVCVAFR